MKMCTCHPVHGEDPTCLVHNPENALVSLTEGTETPQPTPKDGLQVREGDWVERAADSISRHISDTWPDRWNVASFAEIIRRHLAEAGTTPQGSFEALHAEYLAWVHATFPEEKIEDQVKHLQEEFGELMAEPFSSSEYADVLMLLCCVANGHGIDLFHAFREKFTINKARTWKRTEAGYRHEKKPATSSEKISIHCHGAENMPPETQAAVAKLATHAMQAVKEGKLGNPFNWEKDTSEKDPDLGPIGPGHVCKHGIRWPHECDPCAQEAYEAHKAKEGTSSEEGGSNELRILKALFEPKEGLKKSASSEKEGK